jgi:hypothetical protein
MKAGEDNLFHAMLTDAQGKPIADAHMTVSLTMPAMPSMNMPAMKSTFDLPWDASSQSYKGKGNVPMLGTWNLLVEASKGGSVIASFHTHLSAE